MTTETKIELALSDLFAALDERATNKANSVSARLQSFVYRLTQLETVVSRVAKVENRLASMEIRIEDLERDLGDANNCITVLENEQVQMQNGITATHRRIDELKYSDHRRIADLEKRTDDLENDGLDNTRTIIADMINDGDIRLHVD